MVDNLEYPHNRRQAGQVLTIDDLPDDVLLEIFDLYVVRYEACQERGFHDFSDFSAKRKIESWQSLVHVCRRWRGIVFRSPRRLDLQLYCTPRTFEKTSLDIWPALPLFLQGTVHDTSVDNIITGFEHIDLIRQINLVCLETPQIEFEKLWTAMEVPFPELAALSMSSRHLSYQPVLPDSFLGGSAPRLRYFYLCDVPFPGLPNLLLSATQLVRLRLLQIPHSGYISPEAMATCLSALTSLEELQLVFKYPYPDLKSRLPFPSTRYVLPTLLNFWFKGLNEYLGEFVARIDAPQLSLTTLFGDIDFDTPELSQFISRMPTFGAYNEADLIFSPGGTQVRLRQSHPGPSDHGMVVVRILRGGFDDPDRRLSSMAKICTLSLRHLLTVENLYIDGNQYSPLVWGENTEWLDLLLPFTAVKNLYLSKHFSRPIARALQQLTGEITTEVLPALQNVLLEGFQPSESIHEGIARLISARQLTNHPVTISVWDGYLAYDEL